MHLVDYTEGRPVGGGAGGLAEEGPLSAPVPERTITLIIHQHFPRRRSNRRLLSLGGDIVLLTADERPWWPLPKSGRRRVARMEIEKVLKTKQQPAPSTPQQKKSK